MSRWAPAEKNPKGAKVTSQFHGEGIQRIENVQWASAYSGIIAGL